MLRLLTSLLLLLSFLTFSGLTFAQSSTNCGQSEGNQAICCSEGGGCYDVDAGSDCANESDFCSQREVSPEEEEGPGEEAGDPSDVPPDPCGDGICTDEEYTSGCILDCGVKITGSGGSCLPLEFAKVKTKISSSGGGTSVVEGTGNSLSFLDPNQTLKPLNEGLTKVWETLRGPQEATQDPEEYFKSQNSRIFIDGKIVGAPEGSDQLTPQGIDLPISDFSQYSTRAERVSGFTTQPKSNLQAGNQTSSVTDFPLQNFQPQGKIVVPTNPNIFDQILQFARDRLAEIKNWFGGKQEVELSLRSCTYDDIPNYLRAMKIAGLGTLPGSIDSNPASKEILNNTTSANFTIKSPVETKTETLNLQTRGTASLYKSMESLINQISPPNKPMFSFGAATSLGGPNVPLTNSPIPGTTLTNGSIAKINTLMGTYKEAASRYHLPWQMLAAIHYVEGDNNANQSLLNGGALCNNGDGSRGPNCNQTQDIQHDALDAALHLQGKVSNSLAFSGNSEALIKDAFWGYNGRAYGSAEQSPYVMNNWDNAHKNMQWCGITNDKKYDCGIQTIDGTWKVYVLLTNAEYNSSGSIVSLRTGQ